MFYSLDMKIPDIANSLGVSESNVKNKLYRTVNEMKNKFAEKEGAISE